MRSFLGTRIPLISLIQAIAVGEHLNFRHAAAALGVSQSSVSERIRALEETLGVKLFERCPRGVRLTEAGRIFLADVAQGIDQLDHAVKTVGMIANGKLGCLRIGVPTTIAAGFLAELLNCYRQQWPDIDIELFDGPRAGRNLPGPRRQTGCRLRGCDSRRAGLSLSAPLDRAVAYCRPDRRSPSRCRRSVLARFQR